ncbi:MAG: protoporphyrinogen oxidase [Byssovorax sp.]
MSARRVVIVGGGITGLTAAYRLVQKGKDESGEPLSVTVLEERQRLGGNIQTEKKDGFLVDGGPDSFVITKPQATALCKELGLTQSLIVTTEQNRKVYVLHQGELIVLPEGLALGIPTRFLPLMKSPIVPLLGKARMGLDLFIPRRKDASDESIGAFFRRRLGQDAVVRLAEPLLGGIYAGDVDKLSMRATFPQLVELEEKHRSLIRGALAQRAARGGHPPKGKAPPSIFQSLLGGMGQLVDALVAAIEKAGGTIQRGARLTRIRKRDGGFTLDLASGAPIEADRLLLCTPAYVAASAIEEMDREIAASLREIPYLSTGTVTLGYRRADVPHALDASGLVIPRDEGRKALAATFISSKWAGRAPEDGALLRVFVGGHRDPGALTKSDDELIGLGREELDRLIGVKADPILTRVFRYEKSNAQPIVGHGARIEGIRKRAAAHPGLYFAGAAFDGVGIPDCVRQANDAAAAIAAQR